jgi:hypothetical protein
MHTPALRERLTTSLALLDDGTVFVTVSVAEGGVETHAWHAWHREPSSAMVNSARAARVAAEAWVASGVLGLAVDLLELGYVGG